MVGLKSVACHWKPLYAASLTRLVKGKAESFCLCQVHSLSCANVANMSVMFFSECLSTSFSASLRFPHLAVKMKSSNTYLLTYFHTFFIWQKFLLLPLTLKKKKPLKWGLGLFPGKRGAWQRRLFLPSGLDSVCWWDGDVLDWEEAWEPEISKCV